VTATQRAERKVNRSLRTFRRAQVRLERAIELLDDEADRLAVENLRLRDLAAERAEQAADARRRARAHSTRRDELARIVG